MENIIQQRTVLLTAGDLEGQETVATVVEERKDLESDLSQELETLITKSNER